MREENGSKPNESPPNLCKSKTARELRDMLKTTLQLTPTERPDNSHMFEDIDDEDIEVETNVVRIRHYRQVRVFKMEMNRTISKTAIQAHWSRRFRTTINSTALRKSEEE